MGSKKSAIIYEEPRISWLLKDMSKALGIPEKELKGEIDLSNLPTPKAIDRTSEIWMSFPTRSW